ncbi:SRPBCC family protein [Reyranella sp.]|uniref:SRPBCC family protein n=1 Tax=Reyranella sp. TaxID=1929291 RepID=UPI003BA95490
MVALSERTTIAVPAADVWPLLRDPALVASCIPGASLAPDLGDGLWRGSIRVKFGPTVAQFRGEASLAFDDAARTCTIEGRGIDGRGASRALANGIVRVSGDAETELTIDGTFTVSGPLETFANAGGVHVARALLGEFSANLSRLVAERAPATAEPIPSGDAPADAVPTPAATMPDAAAPSPAAAPPPSPAPAAELNAGRLLWQAFLSWLRGLTGKGEKRR